MSGSSFLPTKAGVGRTGVAVASAALGVVPSGGGTCLADAARGNGAGTVAVGLLPALGHGGNGVLLQAASKAAEMMVAVSACSRHLPLGSGLSGIDWGPRALKSAERKVMVWGCKGRKRASRNLQMLPVDACRGCWRVAAGLHQPALRAWVHPGCNEFAGHLQFWGSDVTVPDIPGIFAGGRALRPSVGG